MRLKAHFLALAGVLLAFLVSVFACPVKPAIAARNSSGTFSLYTPGNPVSPGSTISTSWANNTLNDLGTEITNSLDRNGRGPMLAPLLCYAGSVSAPGLSFTSDSNSGLYRAGSHDIRMAVNGSDVEKWNSTGLTVTGKVTASATGSTFAGDAAVDSAGANAGTVTSSLRFGSVTSGESIASKRTATGNQFGLDFYTNSTQRLSITSSGGVQIPGSTATSPGTAITASYGATYAIDFPNTTTGTCSTSSQTLTGVSAGGVCGVSPDAELGGGSHFFVMTDCTVTGANTVLVRWCNGSGGTIDPSSGNFRVRVFQP